MSFSIFGSPEQQQSFVKDISSLITSQNVVGDPNKSVEVELRFGWYLNGTFYSNVSVSQFLPLVEKLQNLHQRAHGTKIEPAITTDEAFTWNSSVYDENQTSGVKMRNTIDANGRKFFLTKSLNRQVDNRQLGLRLSLSLETISDQARSTASESFIIRRKKRWAFPIKDPSNPTEDLLTVDCTEITSDDSEAPVSYEVELEIVNPQSLTKAESMQSFQNFTQVIYHHLYQTNLPMGTEEKVAKLAKVANYLSLRFNPELMKIEFNRLVQPRNLKAIDLVYGGLMPRISVFNARDSGDVYYAASHKADGFRTLMLIDSDGVYLLSTPNLVNKIFPAEAITAIAGWEGTIVECEQIPDDKIAPWASEAFRAAKIRLLIYDILMLEGKIDIQMASFEERRKRAEACAGLFENIRGLFVQYKPFLEMKHRNYPDPRVEGTVRNTGDGLYYAIQELSQERPEYLTDGFIFTPVNHEYGTNKRAKSNVSDLETAQLEDAFAARRGSLSDIPAVVKWKPAEQMSIDFRVGLSPEGNYVLLTDQKLVRNAEGKYNLVTEDGPFPFTGTDNYPAAPTAFDDATRARLLSIPLNSIASFLYDTKSGNFVFLEWRPDKSKPNYITVIEDVWNDIHRPISLKLLKGEEIGMISRKHNGMKSLIFRNVAMPLSNKKSDDKFQIILDIGSGRGQDIDKMIHNGFTHAIFVDPSADNLKELERRLATKKGKLKGYPIQAKGQDTDQIIRQTHAILDQIYQEYGKQYNPANPNDPNYHKVDAISYMLSLSFFFDSQTSVQSIFTLEEQLLRNQGFLMAFTIDGNLLENKFQQPGFIGTDVNGRPKITEEIDQNTRSKKTTTWSYFTSMTLKYIVTTYDNGSQSKEVFVDLPGTIVSTQTEWLVNSNYLTSVYEQKKHIVTRYYSMNASDYNMPETILTKEEMDLDDMYLGFTIQKM